MGQGEDYVYHGKVDFYGIHKSDKLKLSDKQTAILKKTNLSQIFPEYYVLKANLFNNIAKDSLDELIYYFKNNEIKDEFKAKGISKARELWRVDNLNEEELRNYHKHIENLRYGASMAWTMQIDAEERVRKDEKIQFAKKLKSKGMDIESIQELTGLSKQEIEKL